MGHLITFAIMLLSLAVADAAEFGLRSSSADLAQPTKSIFKNPKVHIVINNHLSGGLPLTVYCKSKDDDLGIQLLPSNGNFHFSFRPNYFYPVTLFFCSFQWEGAFHYYNIYDQDRDEGRCLDCRYSIVQNGPCLFNSTDMTYAICDKWNPPDL